MDFMKKLNPFKRIRRQSEQPQQPPSVRQHLRHSADSKRKAADKELQHLNQKIEKILANLDENEAGMEFSREEECVVCLSSKATMKTHPCGHCVVCRLCFVKTIQSAVSERRLPLKCVVCRTKILKLKQQRSRPNNNPPSTSHAPGAKPRGAQPVNLRSTPSSTCSASHLMTTKQNPPPPIRPSVVGAGGHRPTATKLMQPLLIYPAVGAASSSSAVRPGDLKRRPGPGWMSPADPVADPITTYDPVTTTGGTTAAFRHRPKTLLGGSASSSGGPGGGGDGAGV